MIQSNVSCNIILGSSAQGGRGGGSFDRQSMSLNTDYGAEIENQGNLEELFIREGTHASLDGYHANVSQFSRKYIW